MTSALRRTDLDGGASIGPWSDTLQPIRQDAASTQAFTAPQGVWKAPVLTRLRKLATYELGWDGYRGQPIRREVIAFAWRVLEAAMNDTSPVPQIVPLSDGTLQMEWHTRATHIEVRVAAPYRVTVSWEVPGRGVEDEMNLVASFVPLQRLLSLTL